MRIAFIGTVDFSAYCLREVLANGGNVVGVLTLEPENARFNSDYADLSPLAASHKIPLYHIRRAKDPETLEILKSLAPDVIFVFGFSQLIPSEILELPPKGCIGTHPALLPRNRGRHPLIWALVEGLTESGLTFLHLDEGADSGDILWQRSFPISLEDDAQSLYSQIKVLASEAIREFLPKLETGTAPRTPQDHTKATYWRKRTKEDGIVDWNAPTLVIYNLIRALTHPYVGAHTYVDDMEVRIWKAQLLPNVDTVGAETLTTYPPGTVLACQPGHFDVKTGDGILRIVEYDHELLRDVQLRIGQHLGE